MEIDSELAGERLINSPGHFQFKMPEKDAEADEEAPRLNKAEIAELRDTQWEAEQARLVEMSATSSDKCKTLKDTFEENGVEIDATVMANVSRNNF